MKFFPQLILLLLVSATPYLHAEAPVDDLYQARVFISDRSATARQQAYRQGLAQVLIKVSGYSGTPSFEGLDAELSQAERYLLEFAIESTVIPAADGIAVETGEALWMRFNQDFVDDLIRRWEVPVWPSSRPQIGLTMQVSMAGENILLSESNYPAAAALLRQMASRRGVHLTLLSSREGGQLLAGAGLGQASALDLDYWGIAEISQDRFGEREVKLSIESDGDKSLSYESMGQSLAETLGEAFDRFIDEASVGASFIAAGSSGDMVTLELTGISDFASYRRAVNSLSSLEMVDEAKVLQLDLNRVQVRVKLASNLSLLVDAIEQQGILQIEQEPVATNASSAGYPLLQFRYRGN